MNYNYINNLIKSIPFAMAITNKEGIINNLNQNMSDMFGYKKEEILNTSISYLFEGLNEMKDKIASKGIITSKEVYVHTRKNRVKYSLSAYPIYIEEKEDFDIMFIFDDIKRERKLQAHILKNRAIYTFDKIITRNREFLKLIDFAKKISDSKSTVLMNGETGTGKELFAQSIHNESSRRDRPFIAMNMAAIPNNLIESELFGYVEGAFTGAKKGGQVGKFELAHKGTIFLDEIGEMPIELQTRLLRVVEEEIIFKVGSGEPTIVDVRIIAASNKDLRTQVENGTFRKDLFYRLNVLPLEIPPLRDRKDDLPILSKFFMERISNRLNKKPVELNKDILDKMNKHNWPGNVRELENLIEFLINLEYIPNNILEEIDNKELEKDSNYNNYSLEELEKEHIIRILKLYDGNISQASKILQIGRNTLYRKIDKFSINV